MSDEAFIKSHVVDGDILVIKLYGNLDGSTTPEFSKEVQRHFDEGKRKIIIDCGHLGYLSSLGIGALVTLQAKLRKQGGEVKLSSLQGLPAQVIKVVRLDKLLDIYGDTEFARLSFHGIKPVKP